MAYVIGDYSYMPNNVMEPTEVVLKKYDIKHTATATSIEIPGEIMIPNASSAIFIETVAADFCKGNELLRSVVFADNIKYIGANAFDGCSGLTSITIPDSVTSIGSGAFADCSALTSITIPNNVTKINRWVFIRCTNLTSVTYNGTIEQWEAITKGTDWKKNVPSTCIVHCIDGDIPINEA